MGGGPFRSRHQVEDISEGETSICVYLLWNYKELVKSKISIPSFVRKRRNTHIIEDVGVGHLYSPS
jgi:hypothetical protein